MSAWRATWLTWKLHRVEVVVVIVALVMVGGFALVAADHVRGARIPASCVTQAGDGATDLGCVRATEAALGADDEARLVLGAMAILPALVGLLLGVPLVGREIEGRHLALAWSLSGSRRRWLMTRLLPMLGLIVIGLGLVSVGTTSMVDARSLGDGSLADLATYGNAMIARALMALGVGLLAGALVGRTLPAFLLGAAVMVGWGLAGGPILRDIQVSGRLVWMTIDDRDRLGVDGIAYDWAESGTSWDLGPEGTLTSEEQVRLATCGVDPIAEEVTETELACLDTFEMPSTYTEVLHLVPSSTLSAFQAVETAVGLTIGGGALMLTFPVLARRRPE